MSQNSFKTSNLHINPNRSHKKTNKQTNKQTIKKKKTLKTCQKVPRGDYTIALA